MTRSMVDMVMISIYLIKATEQILSTMRQVTIK